MEKKSTEKLKTGQKQRHPHKQTPLPAAEQLGATEKDVVPTTPPMAESDELPSGPVRKSAADEEIDPNEELTPG